MNYINKIRNDFHLKELLKGGAIAMVFKVAGIFAGYFFFWVMARFYGAEGVGYFQTLWTLLMVSSVLGKLGFDTSIVRFVAGFIETKQYSFVRKMFYKVERWLFISGILIMSVLVLLSKQFSNLFFNNPDEYELIVFVALGVLPLILLNYHSETLKALKQIVAFSFFQNGTIYLLTLIFIVVFFMINLSFVSTLWALLISLMFLSITSYFTVNRNLPLVPNKGSKCFPENREIFRITLPMLLSNSLFLIMTWTDTLMVSGFLPESEVGIYATALKIAALNSVVLIAVNTIAMPKFAELYEKDDKMAFIRFVKQSTKIILFSSLPVLLAIFVFPQTLLHIFGEEFEVGSKALVILAIGHFFSAVSGSVINILNMTNRQNYASRILLISTILNIILNLILIPLYGINGSAIATTISTIVWNCAAVYVIYKQIGFVTFPFIYVKK